MWLKSQILVGHVTVWCVFVVVSTNLVVDALSSLSLSRRWWVCKTNSSKFFRTWFWSCCWSFTLMVVVVMLKPQSPITPLTSLLYYGCLTTFRLVVGHLQWFLESFKAKGPGRSWGENHCNTTIQGPTRIMITSQYFLESKIKTNEWLRFKKMDPANNHNHNDSHKTSVHEKQNCSCDWLLWLTKVTPIFVVVAK